MKIRKLRIIFILAFGAGIASLFALVAFDGQPPWWFIAIQLGLALVVLAPAIAFIRGVKWCRPVVAALSIVFLFLWTLSPMAQHAIDRHAGFWVFWSVVEALTIGAAWASLKKDPRPSFERFRFGMSTPRRSSKMKPRSAEQIIDVSGIYDDVTLHEYLSARLGFPGFYGMNWDAFWDCITDDEMSGMPTVLRIKGIEDLRKLAPETERKFSQCLTDYSKKFLDRKVILE